MEPIQGNVSIDAQNIMPIIKKWLYSDKDIFIREVVSNGCDAITKLRMVDSAAAQNCSIHVEVDKAARELRFTDDGIGMTEDEVKTNINQVAFSGAKSFMEEYAKNEDKENSGIIGHFRLGLLLRVHDCRQGDHRHAVLPRGRNARGAGRARTAWHSP